ncbi:pF05037 family protein [Clostridium sp. CAG:575]|nr:pF05037 family protein [Clostridium sp. CAG:575]
MEKVQGYEEAQAITGEYERLNAGGYICKIVSAKEEKSKSGKRMLVLALDIIEGDKKDFFRNRFIEDNRTEKKWPSGAIYRQMLEGEKAAGFLKGLMTSLEASNEGFKWGWDEKKLANLKCGAIFGEEEYEKMDGSVGTTTKIKFIRTIKAIQDGNFKVPELKKLPEKGEAFEDFVNSVTSDNDDLPF